MSEFHTDRMIDQIFDIYSIDPVTFEAGEMDSIRKHLGGEGRL